MESPPLTPLPSSSISPTFPLTGVSRRSPKEFFAIKFDLDQNKLLKLVHRFR